MPQSHAASLAGLCGGNPCLWDSHCLRATEAKIALKALFLPGQTPPLAAAAAAAAAGGLGSRSSNLRKPTRGRHFTTPLSGPGPSHPPVPPLRMRGGRGVVRACASRSYIRAGAGGAGGAALQTGTEGEAMARPLILGFLSFLGLLAAGKRCPPPAEPLPHPAELRWARGERPACAGREAKAGPKAVCKGAAMKEREGSGVSRAPSGWL